MQVTINPGVSEIPSQTPINDNPKAEGLVIPSSVPPFARYITNKTLENMSPEAREVAKEHLHYPQSLLTKPIDESLEAIMEPKGLVGLKQEPQAGPTSPIETCDRKLTKPEFDQLQQLVTTTWDGDLISKAARTELVKLGLVHQYHGWNALTFRGLKHLFRHGELKESQPAKPAQVPSEWLKASPFFVRYKNRLPDPGNLHVTDIDWEKRRLGVTNGALRYYPSFDEVEAVDDARKAGLLSEYRLQTILKELRNEVRRDLDIGNGSLQAFLSTCGGGGFELSLFGNLVARWTGVNVRGDHLHLNLIVFHKGIEALHKDYQPEARRLIDAITKKLETLTGYSIGELK